MRTASTSEYPNLQIKGFGIVIITVIYMHQPDRNTETYIDISELEA